MRYIQKRCVIWAIYFYKSIKNSGKFTALCRLYRRYQWPLANTFAQNMGYIVDLSQLKLSSDGFFLFLSKHIKLLIIRI